MFMIHYKKPILAHLLGLERPRKIRVKAELIDGSFHYTPQAKWFLTWHDNYYSTRSLKSLMWCIYGPKRSKGYHIDQIKLVGVANGYAEKIMKEQAHKLDFFPFDPPKGEK